MKILVVGAGPAGLSTALNASKRGHEVSVFEKDSVLCSKVCGEALAREALAYVDLKPSKKFIVREVKGFRITFKGRFLREVPFENLPGAPAFLIDKPSLLELLKEEAEKAGAEFFFNAKVEKIDPKTGKLILQNGEILQGDLIICADGYGSLARRHLDYSKYDTGIGVQCKCSLPEGLDPEHLHLDMIGEGYAWTFIKRDSANVGLGMPAKSCSLEFLTACLNRYAKNLGVKQLSKIVGAPVAMGGPLRSFGAEKMVAVGEAAGCVMPLSGEGIRFAVYGGCLAYKPSYRTLFMKKCGWRMERSCKILNLVRKLNDDERIKFLECLENPLEILEGQLPKIRDLRNGAELLLRIICRHLF